MGGSINRLLPSVAVLAVAVLALLFFAASPPAEAQSRMADRHANHAATGNGPNHSGGNGPNQGGGNGANQGGPFTSDPNARPEPSMNGNGGGEAAGRPAAGSVGNADDRNPPGQSLNDANRGYECDANHGIGRGNPAHTGCSGDLDPSGQQQAPAPQPLIVQRQPAGQSPSDMEDTPIVVVDDPAAPAAGDDGGVMPGRGSGGIGGPPPADVVPAPGNDGTNRGNPCEDRADENASPNASGRGEAGNDDPKDPGPSFCRPAGEQPRAEQQAPVEQQPIDQQTRALQRPPAEQPPAEQPPAEQPPFERSAADVEIPPEEEEQPPMVGLPTEMVAPPVEEGRVREALEVLLPGTEQPLTEWLSVVEQPSAEDESPAEQPIVPPEEQPPAEGLPLVEGLLPFEWFGTAGRSSAGERSQAGPRSSVDEQTPTEEEQPSMTGDPPGVLSLRAEQQPEGQQVPAQGQPSVEVQPSEVALAESLGEVQHPAEGGPASTEGIPGEGALPEEIVRVESAARGELPDTGGISPLLPAATLLLAGSALGLLAKRRLRR